MKKESPEQQFLKECIADALLLLMKNKPWNSITITEITNLANVSRVTYYRNFKNKEDILIYKVSLLLDKWYKHGKEYNYNRKEDICISLFTYLVTLQDILDTIIQSGLEHILLLSNYSIFEDFITLPISEQYSRYYHAMGLSGFILAWIKRGMKESPEEMGNILIQTIFKETSF